MLRLRKSQTRADSNPGLLPPGAGRFESCICSPASRVAFTNPFLRPPHSTKFITWRKPTPFFFCGMYLAFGLNRRQAKYASLFKSVQAENLPFHTQLQAAWRPERNFQPQDLLEWAEVTQRVRGTASLRHSSAPPTSAPTSSTIF